MLGDALAKISQSAAMVASAPWSSKTSASQRWRQVRSNTVTDRIAVGTALAWRPPVQIPPSATHALGSSLGSER